ncbi:MAG: hypothetical protein PW735_13115 [Acidobacteriaceae bacterium]|nr:hypothetical protein [Acidobacteriaceae bacterium]
MFSIHIARRVLGLAVVLFFALPFGLSVVGCGHKTTVVYCNGGDSGPIVGQLTSLQLSPTLSVTGESLNYGQIGSTLSVTGYDCKGTSVSVSSVVYGTSNMYLADINPSTGQACGGIWNRNTGGGIANYTVCSDPSPIPTSNEASAHTAYLTATANGVASNAIPVYVHAPVTSIKFGKGTDCTTDQDTTCCPADSTTVIKDAQIYDMSSCISQNDYRQIAVQIYAGTSNITCQAGKVTFGTQGASGIVTLDQNGVATARLPGSATLTALLSNSANASSIGYFSTCPPASIVLTPVSHAGATTLEVPLNNTQPFTVTATDTKGASITGLSYTYESTTPQTIPAASTGSVTPVYPGAANIVAKCQPPTCNPAPSDQVGFLGNGTTAISNNIGITTTGTSSTAIYIASTDSQYIYPKDFSTVNESGALVKLPYVPNSMVITQDGTTIYLGSDQGMMTFLTASNAVSAFNASIQGKVLSVSPDGTTVVTTDPNRKTVNLVTSGATVSSYAGAVATSASWSPDSTTVYITTSTNVLLMHTNQNNWTSTTLNGSDTTYTDVTTMVPDIGAYFAGSVATEGRSFCPLSTVSTAGTPPVMANTYAPLADTQPLPNEMVTATNDSHHILGASSSKGVSDLYLADTTGQDVCTTISNGQSPAFTSTTAVKAFTQVTPTSITGVLPASNSDIAFVTFNGTGNGKLPYYIPSTSSPNGALNYITLSTAGGTPATPVAGVWATDNDTFYVGTTGDNLVHLITLTYPSSGAPTATDSSQITPALPSSSVSGSVAIPNMIVQRPRKVTS